MSFFRRIKCFFTGHNIKISIYPNYTWFGNCQCGGKFHIEINIRDLPKEEIK